MSSEVQIAVIDQQDTQIVLAVPGVQGATGSNLPTGGTANQVLRKASSTNYDTDWSLVTNAMVDGSAAIAGTKISPNFGSQNVVTTGTSTAASFIPTSSSVPTNGVYLPSANNVAISTNGTGRLFVDSSGSLGLGTSSPGTALDVSVAGGMARVGGASGNNLFQVYTGSGSTGLGLWAGGASRIYSTGALTFSVNATLGTTSPSAYTDALTIDSSGRVGIGTTSPGFLLDLFGSTPALRIKANGVANGVKLEQSSATGDVELNVIDTYPLIFKNANTERARIDSSGRLLVGTSTARSNFFNSAVTSKTQIEYNDGTFTAGFSCVYNVAGSAGAEIILGKTRSSTIGGNTLVALDDTAGVVSFQAGDGSELVECATIRASIDGTPGTNDMPGRLVFSTTADGASSPTERMRITSDGTIRLINSPGIDFSQIQTNAAGMTSETLNSYEEGSWSPVYTPSSGSFTTMTMSVSGARYVKIGQQVTVSAYFYCSSVDVTGASGSVSITGLPFTSRTTQDVRYSGGIGYAVGFTTKPIDWLIDNGSTAATLLESKTNNDFLDVADLATGSGFLNAMYFTATYFVN